MLRFRHDLVHAAAYDGLSFARRREIHALVGDAIERRSFDAGARRRSALAALPRRGRLGRRRGAYAVLAGDDARSEVREHRRGDVLRARARRCRRLGTAGRRSSPASARRSATCCELAAQLRGGGRGVRTCARARARRASRLLRKRGVVAERHGRYDEALALYDAIAARRRCRRRSSRCSSAARSCCTARDGSTSRPTRREAAAEAAMALGDQEALADAYYIRAAAEGDRGGPADAISSIWRCRSSRSSASCTARRRC